MATTAGTLAGGLVVVGSGADDGAGGFDAQAASSATTVQAAARREASIEWRKPAATVVAHFRARRGLFAKVDGMWILVAEAMGALCLLLFIVWWTLGPTQRRERDAVRQMADAEALRRAGASSAPLEDGSVDR